LRDPTLSSEVISLLLSNHFPESIHEDILAAVHLDQVPTEFKRDTGRARPGDCAVDPASASGRSQTNELCGLRSSAQVVTDPPGKLGVERSILRVPGETITPQESIETLAASIWASSAQNDGCKFAGSIAMGCETPGTIDHGRGKQHYLPQAVRFVSISYLPLRS
jgi:hypothetical protein